jgi:hypothetical protein
VKIASEFDPSSVQQLTRQSRDRQSSVDAWLRQMEAMLMTQSPAAGSGTPEGPATTASRVAVDRPRASASNRGSAADPASTASAGEHRTVGGSGDGRADTAAAAAATGAAHRSSSAAPTTTGELGGPSTQTSRSSDETSTSGHGIQAHARPFAKGAKQTSGAHAAAAASPDPARSSTAHFAKQAPEVSPAIGRPALAAPVRPLALAPQQASTRGNEVSEGTRELGQRAQRAPGDEVPERSMHVHHDGDEVNVTMRDTSLTGEQRTAVIGSLANELRLAGLRLRSATINGESGAVSEGADADVADRFTLSPSPDAVPASPNTSTPWKGNRHG